MTGSKWLSIAKNEYYIQTSRIRKIRPYFPYLIIVLLGLYVLLIAPAFVRIFVNDFIALVLSQAAVAMVQIILFMIFVYIMIIPITDTLREEQTKQLEIILSAPVKPSDIILGEFIGKTPFYAIFITIITGAFTALLTPLGLNTIQLIIVTIIFAVTFLSAAWIGTVIAAVLRTRLGKTAHGKDIGRALAMIIALPIVALVYAFQFGGLFQVLIDPKIGGLLKTILGLLPSSWGAEVIIRFATNPGNIMANGFQTISQFGGLLVFFVAALWAGTKAADRAYSLEPTTFTASTAKPDGVFYKTVKGAGGGGSFGTLVVSLFKDYGRRLENLSNIIYIVGLLFLMVIFVVPNVSSGDRPPMGLVMAQFLFPILAVMITGDVTVQGRDCLFIYRKAPLGQRKLIRAMLMRSWLVAVPVAGVLTAFLSFFGSQTPIYALTSIGLMMLAIAGLVAFVLGLFLLSPAYSSRSIKIGINVMITVFISIGLFVTSLFLLTPSLVFSEPIGMIYHQIVHTALSWLLGAAFLYLGRRKLSRIE